MSMFLLYVVSATYLPGEGVLAPMPSNQFITSNDDTLFGLQVFDMPSTLVQSTFSGRSTLGYLKNESHLLAWSSMNTELASFQLVDSTLKKVNAVQSTDGDVEGICFGLDGEGYRSAVVYQKGGILEQFDVPLQGPIQKRSKDLQPLHYNEEITGCIVHPFATDKVLYTTSFAHILQFDFKTKQVTPVYSQGTLSSQWSRQKSGTGFGLDMTVQKDSFQILFYDEDTSSFTILENQKDQWSVLGTTPLQGFDSELESFTIHPYPFANFTSGVIVLNGENEEQDKEGYFFYDLSLLPLLKPSVARVARTTARSSAPFTCPSQCSQRGECVGPDVCRCRRGFTGETCAAIAIPSELTLYPSAQYSNSQAKDNDDPEVYIHPTRRDHSLILGTTKSDEDGGLHCWTVQGTEIWFEKAPKDTGTNSVDVIYDVQGVDLVVAGIRGDLNAIGVWAVDPDAITNNIANKTSKPVLNLVGNGLFDLGEVEGYGSCVATKQRGYKATQQEIQPSFFVTTKQGRIFEYTLELNKQNGLSIDIRMKRNWKVGFGTQLENCVVDPFTQLLYVGEEGVGVWAYDLTQAEQPQVPEPSYDSKGFFQLPIQSKRFPYLIDSTLRVNRKGKLQSDVEGISIWRESDETNPKSFLVVSSQGSNTYNIYENKKPFRFITKVSVTGTDGDRVTKTDSLVVTGVSLKGHSSGIMVLHDDATDPNGKGLDVATFKVVDWNIMSEIIEKAIDIDID
jgi:myo-inositol-hexaphosphate 3-phosphohydrolase